MSFNDCRNLESVSLPNNITKIPGYMFGGCSSLTDIKIPASVTEIGFNAFYGCSSLTHIDIPASVTKIESQVFQKSGIKELVIPESVTELSTCALVGSMIEKVILPNHITKLELSYRGMECLPVELKSMNLPSSLEQISGDFFPKTLEELIIPDSITQIKFNNQETFKYTKLPLKTQKRLRELGYTGPFAQ